MRIGLLAKLTIGLEVFLLISLFILGVFLLKNRQQQVVLDRFERAVNQVKILANGNLEALITKEYESLKRSVTSVMFANDYSYAYFSSPKGNILVSTKNAMVDVSSKTRGLGTVTTLRIQYQHQWINETIYPVTIDNKIIAYAHLGWSEGDIVLANKTIFTAISGAILVCLLAFMSVFLWVVMRYASLCKQLTIVIANTSFKTISSEPLNQSLTCRSDEIGELSREYQTMMIRLSHAWAALQKEKHELQLAGDRQEQTNQTLQHRNELKDEFLTNIFPKLQTPLNSMIGLAESLIDGITGPLSQQTTQNLSIIALNGRRLSYLVNNLLDFSKLRHHKLQLQTNPLDLRSLASVVLTRSQMAIGNKQLQLINQLPLDLPAVEADENRIQQILYNLVANAITFTHTGTICISAQVQKSYLAITVADTGVGIPKKELDSILGSFEQTDSVTAQEFGEIDLGLMVSKWLTELHGGQIHAISNIGQGSSITFTLPLAKDTLTSRQVDDRRRARSIQVEPSALVATNQYLKGSEIPLNKEQSLILVVDNEPMHLQAVSDLLQLKGYQVLTASSGKEALQILENNSLDLMLLNAIMPAMSGCKVCTEVRKKYGLGELPIVMFTNKNQANALGQGLESGANDFLSKPFLQNEFFYRIKTYLQLKKETDLRYKREAAVKKLNENLKGQIEKYTTQLKDVFKDLKKAQKRMVESEKMVSLGALVAGFAHEINTPLGVGVSAASTLDQSSKEILKSYQANEMTQEDFEEYLEDAITLSEAILKNLNRAAKRVRSFKRIAVDQTNSETWREIEVKTYLEEIILSLHPKYIHTVNKVDINCPKHLLFTTNPGSLAQIITNLVNNSIEHAFSEDTCQRTPVIKISVTTNEAQAKTIQIEYCDNGRGMDHQEQEKIFEPFYTTRRGKGGSGLGLSIVYNLITQQLRGEITCISKVGQGSCFLMIL